MAGYGSETQVDDRGRVIPARVFQGDAEEARFWSEGYVVREFLDVDGVAELIERFAALRPADGFQPDPTKSSQYHCTFLDESRSYREAVDRLTRDLIDPRIDAVLADYEVLTGNFYVKQPGTGRFEVHLNWATVADPAVTTLTIWIPLADTTVEAGTIHVVPGSHKLYPDVATAAATQYFSEFIQELIDDHLVPLELRLGQAVIFDDTLIHWSPENMAEVPRVSLQVEVVPKAATKAVWVPDPADDRWMNVYEVDRTFFLTQDKEVFYGRPDLPCIARVPNANRTVTYQAFCERLRNRNEVRASSYALDV